jgi:hypothetical protein
MKAEHRKELQTNALADWMGRKIEEVRAGNYRHWISWGTGALVLAALAGAWWYFSSSTASTGALMIKLQQANDLKELEQLAVENRGTVPARTARFVIARIYFHEGLRDLASPEMRSDAIQKLLRARELYETLASECGDNPPLAQEALMFTARSEEGLIGAWDFQKNQPAGTPERAMELYRKLAEQKPETFQTKEAGERLKLWQEKRPELEAYYQKLGEQAATKLKRS